MSQTPTLDPLAIVSQFTYDAASRRYRDTRSGRYLPSNVVRNAVDTIIDNETQKARALSTSLIAGDITLAQWQRQMTALLKPLHVALGVAANGGFANCSQADYGYIGSLIKKQYQYLQDMASQIASGQQALDGTLVARTALYTQASRGTYEQCERREAANGGATQERRLLGPADHCFVCVSQAQMGWQPIGTLNAIGESPCKSNCHCTFEYSA